MNIKTHITQEDFAALMLHAVRAVGASKVERLTRVIVTCLFIGMMLTIALRGLGYPMLSVTLLGFAAGGFLMLVFFSWASRRQMQRIKPTDDGCFLGSQEVAITPEGIRVSSNRHQSHFQWSAVCSVALREQHVFVMFDRIAGIVLPLRAFPSEEERDKFVREIEERSGKPRT